MVSSQPSILQAEQFHLSPSVFIGEEFNLSNDFCSSRNNIVILVPTCSNGSMSLCCGQQSWREHWSLKSRVEVQNPLP